MVVVIISFSKPKVFLAFHILIVSPNENLSNKIFHHPQSLKTDTEYWLLFHLEEQDFYSVKSAKIKFDKQKKGAKVGYMKDAIPLKELVKQYQGPDERFVEVTNRHRAIDDILSTSSCTWGAGYKFGETGWIQLATPSKHHKEDIRTIFVCKESLLEGHLLREPPVGVV